MSRKHRSQQKRKSSGASLALVLAVFGGAVLAIMLFCLAFTGFIGSYHEQKSALEAAALAASKDMSSIVIEDPNFGFIGLSDSSPVGTNTRAGDNSFTPVIGINTLFATIKLDMLIAHCMQDPVMKAMCKIDYNNALLAQANLNTALQAAAVSGGTGKDCNGNIINPTDDAIAAYNSNKVHLLIGQQSSLRPGSFKISMGYIPGLHSRAPVPKSVTTVSSTQMYQGFYEPDQVIVDPDSGCEFVFAAMTTNATLVDARKFKASIPGLPYSTPSVVQVEADEQSSDANASEVVHATAAALATTIVDQRPYPGAFTFSFPNGVPPDLTCAADLINSAQVQTSPVDSFQSPLNGDYPQTPMSQYSMPIFRQPPMSDVDPTHPLFQHVFSVALYDWVKQSGTNIDVSSLVNALTQPFQTGSNSPQIQRFHIPANGQVFCEAVPNPWSPVTNNGVSQNQPRAISGLGWLCSVDPFDSYDLQIIDYVRTPGRINGGKHAGQPLDYSPGAFVANPNPTPSPFPNLFENPSLQYQSFINGSDVRSTYDHEGVAVDFTIRLRPQPSL